MYISHKIRVPSLTPLKRSVFNFVFCPTNYPKMQTKLKIGNKKKDCEPFHSPFLLLFSFNKGGIAF